MKLFSISYLTFLNILGLIFRYLLWDRNSYHVRCEGSMFAKTFSCAKCGVNPLILVLWRLWQEDLNSSLHVTEGLGHLGVRDGALSEKLWIRDGFVFSVLSFRNNKPNASVTALLWQRPGVTAEESPCSAASTALGPVAGRSIARGQGTGKPLSIGHQEAKRQHTLLSPASSLSPPPGSLCCAMMRLQSWDPVTLAAPPAGRNPSLEQLSLWGPLCRTPFSVADQQSALQPILNVLERRTDPRWTKLDFNPGHECFLFPFALLVFTWSLWS